MAKITQLGSAAPAIMGRRYGAFAHPATAAVFGRLEFTVPASRLEFSVPAKRLEFTTQTNRLEYTAQQ